MAEKDDSAWVFDSLVGFLQGPIWSAPLLTFIEEKSLIFEPGTTDSKEYRDVYQEYKNLVDLLLGCYMEDMNISTEQFERACTLNRSTRVPVQFQQSLFEQIWAANDYEVFRRMMIQKNLELQLQALKIIEQKFGLIAASASHDGEDIVDELPIEEFLQKESQADVEKAEDKKEEEKEEEDDDDVVVNVEKDEETLRSEHERLAAEYRNESALFLQALKKSTDRPPILEEDEEEENLEEAAGETGLKFVPTDNEGFSIKPRQEANEEEVRKRQLYLKAQRDKLVALKKRSRSRRLQHDVGSQAARPSSARVLAEASVEGELAKANQPSVDPAVLQVRRALAARLKAEVVQK